MVEYPKGGKWLDSEVSGWSAQHVRNLGYEGTGALSSGAWCD